MSPIRLGVLGCSLRGMYLARALGQDPRVRITALCDLLPDRLEMARRQCERFAPRVYTKCEEFLADPELDAVVVATHDAAHGRNGLDVLRARKHLFLEKPMAQSISECDAMIEEWKRAQTVFMIGLELRYCSLCEQMKRIIDEGRIGTVVLGYAVDNVSVGGQYYYHGPRRRKEYIRSLVLEKGTHTLDLMNWFIGGSPVRVYSEGGLNVFGRTEAAEKRCRDCDRAKRCPYFVSHAKGFQMDYGVQTLEQPDLCVHGRDADVDDNSVLTVRYDNGARMTYVECHFTPDYTREFTLIGDQGRLYGFYNNEQEFRIELTWRHSAQREVLYPEKRPGGHGGGDPGIQREFLDRVAAGRPCALGVRGARDSAAIAIAAGESAESGEAVAVPPCPITE
jgi:predicted dehydrogenase